MSEGENMALNEKDYELINEFMEQVCRLANLKSPFIFMSNLKGFSQDKGIGGDGWCVTTEFFEADKMTKSDIEYLGGRKIDGVVFDSFFNTSEPPTTILSYQEFYDILCEYVERAIKDKDAAFQIEARSYLRLFKEKHNLK